jgi:hypothetical protein
MEPEGSLPCSQETFTGPYPEPDRSSSYHPNVSKIHFHTAHPPTAWSPSFWLPKTEFWLGRRKTKCHVARKLHNEQMLWRMDPLLSGDSVNSDRLYVTPATYTYATIEGVMQPASKQRIGNHASTTIVAVGNYVLYSFRTKWL